MEIPISLGSGGGGGSDEVTATKNDVLAGYTAVTSDSDDEPVEGTIPSKAAEVYETSSSDQTISAGQYLAGTQTIRAVRTVNLSAANIKKDVVVKVGDADSAGSVADITGTYTTISAGQTAVVAGALLAGYSGFADGGSEVQGSIPAKSAEVYNTSTNDRAVNSAQYLSGIQTIKAVTTSNVTAANFRKGINAKVGDTNDEGRIIDTTGTYTTVSSGQSAATAGSMLAGYAGFANGSTEIVGTIPSKAAATYTPTTSNQTIAAGQYLSGAQTVKGDANLVAANIKSGVNLFGVAGSATALKGINGTQYTRTSGSSSIAFEFNSVRETGHPYIQISNHGFVPKAAFMIGPMSSSSPYYFVGPYFWNTSANIWRRYAVSSANQGIYTVNKYDFVLNSSTLIRLPAGGNTSTYNVYCWGY